MFLDKVFVEYSVKWYYKLLLRTVNNIIRILFHIKISRSTLSTGIQINMIKIKIWFRDTFGY